MANETILQNWLVMQFILPFLLIVFIVYAVLEKTNLFGEGKHQINGLVAGVIGLIFVGAIFPKFVVENLVLFLSVAIVIVFVTLLLWGFVSGSNLKENFLTNKYVKWTVGVFLVVVVIIAIFVSTGVTGELIDFLFRQSWSKTFWTNFLFVVVVAGALAFVIKSK